jgi:hypothetical protein
MADSIPSMIKARESLETRFVRFPEYNKIYHLIIEYIHKFCEHEVVDDYVDTDTETSVPIKYCQKCYSAFPK